MVLAGEPRAGSTCLGEAGMGQHILSVGIPAACPLHGPGSPCSFLHGCARKKGFCHCQSPSPAAAPMSSDQFQLGLMGRGLSGYKMPLNLSKIPFLGTEGNTEQ